MSDLSLSQIFDKREAELMKRSLPLECTCFKTSIWDETLYKVSLVSNNTPTNPLSLFLSPCRRGRILFTY